MINHSFSKTRKNNTSTSKPLHERHSVDTKDHHPSKNKNNTRMKKRKNNDKNHTSSKQPTTPHKRKSTLTAYENSPSKRRRTRSNQEIKSPNSKNTVNSSQNEVNKKQEEYLNKQKQHFDFIDSQPLEEEDEEVYIESSQQSIESSQQTQESNEFIDYKQIMTAASQKLSEVPHQKLMKHMYPRIEQEYREYCEVMSSYVAPVSFEEYAAMELKHGNDKVQLFVLSDEENEFNESESDNNYN